MVYARLWEGLRAWLPVAAVATVLSVLVNVTVQQSFRMGANDPQIQLAEDAAAALQAGGPLAALGRRSDVIEIGQSLALWIALYDDRGHPLAATARLDGALPVLPNGVFDHVRSHGVERVTWQPRRGLRIALVVARSSGPNPRFVAAGRSLREVERRVDSLNLMTLLAWAIALLASLGIALLCSGSPRTAVSA